MNKRILIIIGLLILLAVIPLTGSRYYVYLTTEVLSTILFAVSLNLLVGYAGLFSLGHAGFFGIGAYAFSLLLKKAGLPFWSSFVIAPFLAGGKQLVFRNPLDVSNAGQTGKVPDFVAGYQQSHHLPTP